MMKPAMLRGHAWPLILGLVACSVLCAPAPSGAALDQPATVISLGSPFQVSFGSYAFLNVSIQSYLPGVNYFILFGVIKNSQGQTIGVSTGGVTVVGPGLSNAYALVYNVPAGSYFVAVFVIDAQYNAPVSLVVSATITV